MLRSRITMILFAVAAAALTLSFGAPTTKAQAIAPDVFQVNYYSGANTRGVADGTVRIVNPGTSGGTLCANIYVFSPDQQLDECCSCPITPNGLLTLSVNRDLTSNTLTGRVRTSGVIKIVSSACGAAPTGPGGANPVTAGLRAWATHIQRLSTGANAVTEEEFQDAGLSAAELARITDQCSDIGDNGSGSGICTCGAGTGP